MRAPWCRLIVRARGHSLRVPEWGLIVRAPEWGLIVRAPGWWIVRAPGWWDHRVWCRLIVRAPDHMLNHHGQIPCCFQCELGL